MLCRLTANKVCKEQRPNLENTGTPAKHTPTFPLLIIVYTAKKTALITATGFKHVTTVITATRVSEIVRGDISRIYKNKGKRQPRTGHKGPEGE